ncbi:hypothetical protein C9374_012077 [Naegleria lovaniensis]|uniref:GIY-YIG domain-containing protein n=1 Tax=Naegleria lovaniensis TaxID=51637 RepID=A0AA88G830_NAELO|nr:uncharacterized protein C9374_012077 [Naegleria lovaniensis]KAG2373470.1 hypothetical protein C9374_012077 [Naegleria lovaniensis]
MTTSGARRPCGVQTKTYHKLKKQYNRNMKAMKKFRIQQERPKEQEGKDQKFQKKFVIKLPQSNHQEARAVYIAKIFVQQHQYFLYVGATGDWNTRKKCHLRSGRKKASAMRECIRRAIFIEFYLVGKYRDFKRAENKLIAIALRTHPNLILNRNFNCY